MTFSLTLGYNMLAGPELFLFPNASYFLEEIGPPIYPKIHTLVPWVGAEDRHRTLAILIILFLSNTHIHLINRFLAFVFTKCLNLNIKIIQFIVISGTLEGMYTQFSISYNNFL